MTDYTNLQTRCQRGEATLADANNLLAECHAALGRVIAENAGLRTGYQAYERVSAELKAEVEGLRKEAERYRFLRNGPDGLDLSSAETMEEVDALIDAAMGKGEQS
jgi:hypothetical protein